MLAALASEVISNRSKDASQWTYHEKILGRHAAEAQADNPQLKQLWRDPEHHPNYRRRVLDAAKDLVGSAAKFATF